jgi:hypothetical protein
MAGKFQNERFGVSGHSGGAKPGERQGDGKKRFEVKFHIQLGKRSASTICVNRQAQAARNSIWAIIVAAEVTSSVESAIHPRK